MAAEREIKTVLTLEDASFTKGLRAATANVSAIRAEMNAAISGASGLGKGMKQWKAQVTGLSSALKAQKNQMGLLNRQYTEEKKKLAEASKALKDAQKAHGQNSEEVKKASNAYAYQSTQVDELRVKMAKLSTQMNQDKDLLHQRLTQPLKMAGAAAKTFAVTIGAAMVTAGAAFVALGKKSLEARQQLNADISASQATFGVWSNFIEQDADKAWKNLGLSKDAYLQHAVTIGKYMEAAGLDMQQSASVTSQALQTAADLAGVYGTDTSSALDAIEKAGQGSYRSMRRYGLTLTTSTIAQWAMNKGLITAEANMTKEQEAAFAVQMILEKAQDASNGFATRTDNVNAALEQAQAAWDNFIAGAGSADSVIEAFSNAAGQVSKEVLALTPELTRGITELIQGFVAELPNTITTLGPALESLVSGILDTLTGNAESIGEAAGTLAGNLASELILNIPTMIRSAIKMAKGFLNGFLMSAQLQWKTNIWPALQKTLKIAFGIDLPDWDTIESSITDFWKDTVLPGIENVYRIVFGVDPPKNLEELAEQINGFWTSSVLPLIKDVYQVLFGVEMPESWDRLIIQINDAWNKTIYPGIQTAYKALFGVDMPTSWGGVITQIKDAWNKTIYPGIQTAYKALFGVEMPTSWGGVIEAAKNAWKNILYPTLRSVFNIALNLKLPEDWDSLLEQINSGDWGNIAQKIGDAAERLGAFLAPFLGFRAYEQGKTFIRTLGGTFGVTADKIKKAGGGITGFFKALDLKGFAVAAAFEVLYLLITRWDDIWEAINKATLALWDFLGLNEKAQVTEDRVNHLKSAADTGDLDALTFNLALLIDSNQLDDALKTLQELPEEMLLTFLTDEQMQALQNAQSGDEGNLALLTGIKETLLTILESDDTAEQVSQALADAEKSAQNIAATLDGTAGSISTLFRDLYKGGGGIYTPAIQMKNAGGAWNVPFDNYIARLHSGEMVLTADQARRYRAQTAAGNTYNDSASIYIDKYNQYSSEDADALLARMQTIQRQRRSGYGLA